MSSSETNGDVSIALLCPVETNGLVNISHEGYDGALFWSDASATQPLSSLTGISLSSVTEKSGGTSYTFYIAGATRLLCRVNEVTCEIMLRSRPVEDP